MTLIYRILWAAHANGTHHKLALEGLRRMRGSEAEAWRRVFLAHAEAFLEGSKAPDKTFKDFQNHCLHISDEPGRADWGGAEGAAAEWWRETVRALARRDWGAAAFSAGVASHYYSDPLMPFHTGSSEAESVIHRAAEWSISKSFDRLWGQHLREDPTAPLSLGAAGAPATPHIALPTCEEDVAAMVRRGAEASRRHYQTLIDTYDFRIGVKTPEYGYNEDANAVIARLLRHAADGIGRLLAGAVIQSGAAAPQMDLTAHTVIAGLKIPMKWVLNKLEDAADRREVAAIYREYQETGRVEATLPEEQRSVRRLRAAAERSAAPRKTAHETILLSEPAPLDLSPAAALPPDAPARDAAKDAAASKSRPTPDGEDAGAEDAGAPDARSDDKRAENRPTNDKRADDKPAEETRAPADVAVLRPQADANPPAKPSGKRAAKAPRSRRPRLRREAPVEKAPSIGPKTAARLAPLGVVTVGDLLDADPERIAEDLADRRISARLVARWRDQARLLTHAPDLKAAHAVMLVACGYRDLDAIAAASPAHLRDEMAEAARSDTVRRALRNAAAPDLETARAIIDGAKDRSAAA
ncbi:MAG: DUF4332 domain-containing protein [Pseudomonadota bacterium]